MVSTAVDRHRPPWAATQWWCNCGGPSGCRIVFDDVPLRHPFPPFWSLQGCASTFSVSSSWSARASPWISKKMESRRADTNRSLISLRVIIQALQGLHGVASPAHLRGFDFPGLQGVAPYCVRGAVKGVSNFPGSRIEIPLQRHTRSS